MSRKKFYTARELAVRWGKCEETIGKMCRAGRLPHLPHIEGSHWQIPAAAVERYENGEVA